MQKNNIYLFVNIKLEFVFLYIRDNKWKPLFLTTFTVLLIFIANPLESHAICETFIYSL